MQTYVRGYEVEKEWNDEKGGGESGRMLGINDVATTTMYEILKSNNKCLFNWKIGNKND